MSLSPGNRLGPYEILAPLGAGGMGEVYRARDERLKREVAIKVLPVSLSADADRLRRFEQEAQAAGALNHPNILAIYDVGTHEGSPYVVSELLEGETLRERLTRGSLPVGKVTDYAIQIADGLAAAQEKGIVHRDLKPENLFVTKDGRVKILDFGLAKVTHPEPSGMPLTEAPTLTAATEAGVVMGTVGYMSPEQVRGQRADHRSDLFALGAILYEILSGCRAFHGDSAADTMSAILREEPPDLNAINPDVSPGLERIVRHCLEKTAEQRFQSARDLAFDLEGLSAVSGERHPAASSRSPAGSASEHPVYRRLTFRRGIIVSARFSPDAQTILCCARWEGDPLETFAMRLDSPESRPLGLPEARLHAVSASGEMAVALRAERWVGSPAGGVLARMPLAGGAPREVLEDVKWADWSPDGSDLAVVRVVGERVRLDFPIGTPLYEPSAWIAFPRVSPGGDLVAFIDYSGVGDTAGSVAVVDRKGRVERLSGVWEDTQGLAWSPGGEEIWFTASNVGAARALHAVTLNGRARLVAQVPGGLFLHDFSRSGGVLLSHEVSRSAILCRIADQLSERELSWFDNSTGPDLSDDGNVLLFSERGGGKGPLLSTYLRRTDGSPAIRLGDGIALALSPDGKWALSLSVSPGRLLLHPTGTGQTRELHHAGLTHHPFAAWFPDGKRILFAANEEGRHPRSFIQSLDGPAARPVTPEGTIAYAISPDGRFVAAGDLVPRLYPADGGDPIPIPGSLPGDTPIRWDQTGRCLFVHSGYLPARVFRIDMATGLREPFLEMMPSDPAGIVCIDRMIALTPDARSYAYSYAWMRSDLYLVEGLR